MVRRLTERSLLAADDPELAAQHLNHLILAGPLDEAMFTARTTPFPRSRLHRWSDEAVRIFLAAYEPRRSTDGRQDPQAP